MASEQCLLLLDISHLKEVFQVLRKHHFTSTNYYQFGLVLGLLENTLKAIEKDHRGDTARCLLECLSSWLRKVDNVENASWYTLIAALKSIGDHAVAQEIAQEKHVTCANADGTERLKHPACMILDQYHSQLSLQNLVSLVIPLLLKEGIIKQMLPATGKTEGLLTAVQEAVCVNHKNLETFAVILLQFTATVPVGNAILKDYREKFCSGNIIEVPVDDEKRPRKVVSVEIHIPLSLNLKFESMRAKFAGTMCKVQEAINISVEKLKNFYQFGYPYLKPQLVNCRTTKDVLLVISERCTLINISLLEAAVNELNIEEAQTIIKQYKESITEFCQKLSLRFCLNEKFSSSSPLQCQTATFLVNRKVDDCTLKDIDDLVTQTFEELSKKVNVVVIKEKNSFTITCSFPLILSESLIATALRNLNVLVQEKGLLQLIIGYSTVYDVKMVSELHSNDSFTSLDWVQAMVYNSKSTLDQMIISRSVQLHVERDLKTPTTPESEWEKLLEVKDQQIRAMILEIEQLKSPLKNGALPETTLQQPVSTQNESGYKLISLTAVDGRESEHKAVPLFHPNNMTYDVTTNELTPNGEKRSSLCICPVGMELLANIRKPIAVLSIAGPARTGKSYILSRVLDSHDAFELGHSNNAQTHGIWIGTQALEYDDHVLVLLDTEGIDASDGNNDANIVKMTLLMSSCFIYNSVGVPKRENLEKMRVFTKLAQSVVISSNTSQQQDPLDLQNHFPSFLWLLRDFNTKLKDYETGEELAPRDYLVKKVLRADTKQPQQDEVKTAIRNSFPAFDCHILPSPSTDPDILCDIAVRHEELEDKFKSGVTELITHLRSSVTAKKGFQSSEPINGRTLAQLAEKYIEALNSPDSVLHLDDTWAAVAKLQCSEIQNVLVQEYRALMKQKMDEASEGHLPLEYEFEAASSEDTNTTSIMSIHHSIYSELKEKLLKRVRPFITDDFATEQNRIVKKFEHAIVQYEEGKIIGGVLRDFNQLNEERSTKFCREIVQEQYGPIEARSQSGDRSYTYQQYTQDIAKARETYLSSAKGPAKQEVLEEWQRQLEQSEKNMKQHQQHLDELAAAHQREVQTQQMLQAVRDSQRQQEAELERLRSRPPVERVVYRDRQAGACIIS